MSLSNALIDYTEWRKNAAWINSAGSLYVECYDCDGSLIKLSEYGLLSEFGWEVDQVVPSRVGGPDHFDNLRARHWRGNRRAGGLLGAFLTKDA
jgi:hypothetical protein